ncbi:hypothetical protein EDC01DRAFT_678729 [Geopyxis carbonaria]|nr:hypothetical protein EDC01DRAFT_678729 [Geopyxis carbonaria]
MVQRLLKIHLFYTILILLNSSILLYLTQVSVASSLSYNMYGTDKMFPKFHNTVHHNPISKTSVLSLAAVTSTSPD